MGRAREVALLAALLLVGCGGDETVLLIDLRTDIRAGVEFSGVRITLTGDATDEESTLFADPAADYLTGVRILEREGLAPGAYVLTVDLVEAGGTTIASRPVRVVLEERVAATVVITRSCRGVMCPGPEDDATSIACFAGQCVAPECTPETPESCQATECDTDGDCESFVGCVTGRCRDGACFAQPADDQCPGAQICYPDVGCADPPDPPADAGVDTGTQPPIDSGMDAAVDSGPRDAAPDTSDGATDASPDAPVDAAPDAACADQAMQSCSMAGCACNSGCSCDLSCSTLLTCNATCSEGSSCTLNAPTGVSEIDLTCEGRATCTATVGGFRFTSFTCRTDSDCSVTCGASDCHMDCRSGASCLLRCTGIGFCEIEDCGGGLTSCPGRVVVCNRACP